MLLPEQQRETFPVVVKNHFITFSNLLSPRNRFVHPKQSWAEQLIEFIYSIFCVSLVLMM